MERIVKSLSFRLALTYAGLFCASLVLLFAAYYWLAVARPLAAIRTQVDGELAALAQVHEAGGRDALAQRLEQRARRSRTAERAFHALIAPDGRVVTSNLTSWPSTSRGGFYAIEADVSLEGGEIDFSALSRERIFADGTRLIVGRNAERFEEREQSARAAFPVLIVLVLLLAVAGGYLMSRAIGLRIEAISGTARKVMTGRLGERVPVHGSGDDFDRLSETLNLMLERNEALFQSVRRVSDNLAHELRTPLSRVQAQLEQAVQAHAGERTRMQVLDAALREMARLQAIFDALLRIGRIEEHRHDIGFAGIDLAAIMRDAVELYEPAAAQRGIALSAEGPSRAILEGDRDLLFQAIGNLLDNAVKYARADGAIRVSLADLGDSVRIAVGNDGPPLRQGEADRLSERFFRGSGAIGLPGHGLGLTLVAAIVRRHEGELDIVSSGDWTSVAITLPRPGPLSRID
jgi:signal transduction histidine kinase